ncbi:MAG: hypothetical protein K5694_06670 [Bacilli bacterium]|nr:hypothetical protein [Bacilli bacterium]
MIKFDAEKLQREFEIGTAVENKLLITREYLTTDEVGLLKGKAEGGSPRYQFDYGLHFLFDKQDEKTASTWWEKCLKHANGEALWKFSGVFASLGDEYYEWSMRFLRRSAWRQFPLAKGMLKEMKANPYKFPEA